MRARELREEARGSKRKPEEARGGQRKPEEARGSQRKPEEARGNLKLSPKLKPQAQASSSALKLKPKILWLPL